MHRKQIFFILFVLSLILAACSSAGTPELIASYPTGGEAEKDISGYMPQDPMLYVYDAYLEVESASVKESARKAERVAIDNGGYLVSRESWIVDGHTRALLVLAVPAARFETAYEALKHLGRVLNEQVSGEWQISGYRESEWTLYSQITLRLQLRASVFPVIRIPSISTGWHPGRTLESALSVALTIFGFLADILIWALVVVGPFVLLYFAGRLLLRHLLRKPRE